MKFKLLLVSLLCCVYSFGQIQDLEKMAEGKIVYNSTLYDTDENIFGYLYLYEQDANDSTKTMEYIFLDKNLNKVSNGTFPNQQYSGVKSQFYDCTLMGDNVILNKLYYYLNFTGNPKLLLSTYQTISLKDAKVTPEFKYENGQFPELKTTYETMKKEYKGQDVRYFINAFSNEDFNGFFIIEDNKKDAYLEKEVSFFDNNRNLAWKFEFNPNGKKRDYKTFRILYSYKNTIYVSTPTWSPDEYGGMIISNFNIIALDLKTGKKRFEYVINSTQSEYSHTLRLHQTDNKLTICGNYSPYKTTGFSMDQNLGYFKIVLDEQGNVTEKKYTQWSDFSNQMEIDKRGRVEKNYQLRPIKFFFFKDGSVSILTEKFKYNSFSQTLKGTDFVLFNMKSDFTPGDINTIVKEKSYFSTDFLFSQYIKDNTGVAFFYTDVVKNPDSGIFSQNNTLMLGINTIIGGKLTEEKLQLNAKKKYFIEPHRAKEGYILLREYNEKDKYNQIRLEKMNY